VCPVPERTFINTVTTHLFINKYLYEHQEHLRMAPTHTHAHTHTRRHTHTLVQQEPLHMAACAYTHAHTHTLTHAYTHIRTGRALAHGSVDEASSVIRSGVLVHALCGEERPAMLHEVHGNHVISNTLATH
jgi:hypothetical protein